MSNENVGVVQRAPDVFSADDADALAALTTPDLECKTGLGAVEGEVFPGHEGVETYFHRLAQAHGTSSGSCLEA